MGLRQTQDVLKMITDISKGIKRIWREILANEDPQWLCDFIYRIGMIIAVDKRSNFGGMEVCGKEGVVLLKWDFSEKLDDAIELFDKYKERGDEDQSVVLIDWEIEEEGEGMNVRVDVDSDRRLGIHTDVEDILFSKEEVERLVEVLNSYLKEMEGEK